MGDVEMAYISVEEVRITHLEADMAELKNNDKDKTKSIVEIEKSNIKMDGNVEKIFEALTELKRTTESTEHLTTNLKTVTDKQTEDLRGVKDAVTATSIKVIAIEALPAENAKTNVANAKKMKFLIWQFVLGSGIAIVISLYKGIIWVNDFVNR